MKDKASISHDRTLTRELRESPNFAAEYLRAALEDTEEPEVLRIALRRIEAAGKLDSSSRARVQTRRPTRSQ